MVARVLAEMLLAAELVQDPLAVMVVLVQAQVVLVVLVAVADITMVVQSMLD